MKFFISNPALDKEIADIRLKIRLSMNGVVSDKMHDSGLQYKKNYGVAVTRIREIAKEHGANHDLAQRLWSFKIRETMILATLLEPTEKFGIENARLWLKEVDQNELAEQLVMNLLVKTDFSEELIQECLESENNWMHVCAFLLAARLYNKISVETQNLVIEHGFEKSKTNDLHVYKSIATCFGRFCRNGEVVQQLINTKINAEFSPTHTAQNFIKDEVSHEILFFQN